VVEATSWADAFSRLRQAGLAVALAGRTLRLPGITPADAEAALTSQPVAVPGRAGATDYRVESAPATLEERFFELASAVRPAQQQTSVPA
jgi:hypothetical protein